MLWARPIGQNEMVLGRCSVLLPSDRSLLTGRPCFSFATTRTFCEIAFGSSPVGTTSTSPFPTSSPAFPYLPSLLRSSRPDLNSGCQAQLLAIAVHRLCLSRSKQPHKEPSCRRQLYVRTSRHVSPIIVPMYYVGLLRDRASQSHPIATISRCNANYMSTAFRR